MDRVPPFVRRFWAWLLSLAAVVGLYLGALQVQLTVVFWVVLAVAVVGAGVRPAYNLTVDAAQRYRTQPGLLRKVGELEQAVADARSSTAAIASSEEISFERGIAEGIDRANAIVVGSPSGALPAIVAAKLDEDGVALLVARYEDGASPSEHARFNVELSVTGDCYGAVGVVRDNPERRVVYLRPVHIWASQFWDGLARRAGDDNSPPPGIELSPYTLPGLPAETTAEAEAEDSDPHV